MTDQQFDKFFRDSLRDHQSPVPDDMWSRINPEEEKKRRVFFIPRWYALVAVLLLMAGGYFTWQLTKEDKTKTTIADSGRNDDANSAKANETQQGTADDNATAKEDNKLTHEQTATASGEDASVTTANDANKQALRNDENAVARANKNVVVRGEVDQTNQAANGDKSVGEKVITQDKTDGLKTIINENKLADNSDVREKKDAMNDDVAVQAQSAEVKTINKDSVIAANDKNTAAATAKKQDKKSAKRGVSIEAYASPDAAWKISTVDYTSYVATIPAALGNQAYLEKSYEAQQKHVYKQRLSYSAGLRVVIPISKKFSLKTGLQYSQVNEKFDFEANDAQRDYAIITSRYLNLGSSTFLPIFDTAQFMASGFQKKVTYNKYRSFNLPLLVSYETGNNSFNWGATVGAVININSWYSGDMLSADFKAVSIKSENVFKKNTGVSLYAGFTAAKKLNTQWQVFAEPHVQYALSNMTNSKAYVQQKFASAGLAVGLRYTIVAPRQHK